jgi:hypothetical protein
VTFQHLPEIKDIEDRILEIATQDPSLKPVQIRAQLTMELRPWMGLVFARGLATKLLRTLYPDLE